MSRSLHGVEKHDGAVPDLDAMADAAIEGAIAKADALGLARRKVSLVVVIVDHDASEGTTQSAHYLRGRATATRREAEEAAIRLLEASVLDETPASRQ